MEAWTLLSRMRVIWPGYDVGIFDVGPDRIPTKVLCDFREFPDRRGGWTVCRTRKLSYRQDDRAMRPIYGCMPWKFSRVPEYAHGYFSLNFNGLVFRAILWMCVQNLKFVALPVPEIIGGTPKNWAVPGYAHAPLSTKILMGFCSDWACECSGQIWSS